MGELVAGTPALRVDGVVSLPLDLVSVLSLLYRAERVEGLDPWLAEARARLPGELRRELDLLHGFSGGLLYYPEEPVMRFGPLREERRGAGFAELLGFLEGLPAESYREMAADALERVHRDQGRELPFLGSDPAAWRLAFQRGLTTARMDEVFALVEHPALLKERTIALYRGVWEAVYREEYAARLPQLRQAAAAAAAVMDRGFGRVFEELTGNRPPAALRERLGEVRRVSFCPSPHLGGFVSYMLHPPDLIVFFGAPEYLARQGERRRAERPAAAASTSSLLAISDDALLEALRAVADPTRLQILDLLGDGELYAQEIVGRLGLAQSAVSRHLSQMERSGLVTVEARRGAKFYRVGQERLDLVADGLRRRSGGKAAASVPSEAPPPVEEWGVFAEGGQLAAEAT